MRGKGRIHQPESSRTVIYVSQKVASDSAFPFKPGDDLAITIDTRNQRLVIEKA